MAKDAKTSGSEDGGRKSADDWVMAALRVLSAQPISEVKVERLASDLGVTKGSFYWHFSDRNALLVAMRAMWVEIDTRQIIELVDGTEPELAPVEALRRLIVVIFGSTGELDGVEAAIREWSVHDPATAEVCVAVDEQRLQYVAGWLVAGGLTEETARKRAELLYRVVIGEYIWRRYRDSTLDVATVLEFVEQLFEP